MVLVSCKKLLGFDDDGNGTKVNLYPSRHHSRFNILEQGTTGDAMSFHVISVEHFLLGCLQRCVESQTIIGNLPFSETHWES